MRTVSAKIKEFGDLGMDQVFACFPGAYFSGVPVTFVDFGFKMVLKINFFLVPDYITKRLFLDEAPTSG